MITDLHYMFREFDKTIFSDAKIHNPNFKINTINKDKIFDTFYIRFYAGMIFFNYNNNQKISLIKRNLPDKLAYKIIDDIMERLFPQFANKYRTIDTQTR